MSIKILGIIVGGVVGLLYYKKAGWPIASNLYGSVAYGAIMGFLIA